LLVSVCHRLVLAERASTNFELVSLPSYIALQSVAILPNLQAS
jgi:hypothetical protein